MTYPMEDSVMFKICQCNSRAITAVLVCLVATALAGIRVAGAAVPAKVKEFAAAVFPAHPDCNGPRTFIISSNDDWKRINDSLFDVFCVLPGDYTTSGPVVISQHGSAAKPKWLLLNDPANPTDETHPVKLAVGKRAILKQLVMDGASYWMVDRIAIDGSLGSNQIINGATDVVWNRMLVEDVSNTAAVALNHGVRNITIQNSVIRNMVPKPRVDLGCIEHERDTNTRILSNELYNCASNGIQLSGAGSSGSIAVENNDVYLTSQHYCNTLTGRLDPSGTHSASEDGYVLKGYSGDATVLIRNNRFWGLRPSLSRCGTTSNVPASGVNLGAGNTVVRNVIVVDNIFDDIRDWGIYVSNRVEEIMVSNNVMAGVPVPTQNIYAKRYLMSDNEVMDNKSEQFCYERRQWTGPEVRCIP